ncbi:single-stranded-DNA-specific exonuclease RecJ [Weissella cibaria]|uniref:Single-stranded-DNA-specific exonuclease RecJ n=1 Tax=Weissella cibaria TaxID=137591 RepID=A0A9Q8JI06_9LACO|nr:single-stranded-DNA-specific exonuclease RecJ [Weissella cibaria]TVV27292.1 single-stranded-DNA-specific exonuclease RecJ [Weissella cibaria]TVV40489.1 single-stranded-DNA-specific exonuclease RecJ [Weissella cibaria]
MISPHYQWDFPAVANEAAAKEIAETFGVSELVAKILVNRGYDTIETANAFLRPGIEGLYDPFLLPDMDVAITRIMTAIDNGEKIVVYGDYDVDGITSTAIMTWALELMGADVSYYVPNRFKDGYGPNLAQYQRLAGEGMQLLITVDNGVSGRDEVAWLMNNGVDVIVTDHHEMPAELPEAVAVVHPRHPEGAYPFGGLSGAGVAFKVASALLEEPADEVMDLAALGAVADVMELVDENRAIVAMGLANLKEDPRPGLAALLQTAGTNQADIDSMTIGFTIGPRLNALGRLADATDGVRLLLADDPEEASALAGQIETLNRERQELVATISDEALAQAQTLTADPVLVIAGQGWHEGVLGIVASKVVEATGKPAIVLNDEDGQMKGSGRSVPAFDLFAGLDGHRDLLTAFGGHASAAGMTIPTANLQAVRDVLRTEADAQGLAEAGLPEIRIAAEVTAKEFNAQNYEQLQVLAPFGEGNPEPLFAVALNGVQNVKTMSEGKHLRFTASTQVGSLPVIAFGRGSLAEDLAGRFESIKIVGTMSENRFRGDVTYQMMLTDIEAAGSSLLDWRTTRLTRQTLAEPASYIFFNKKHYEQLGPTIQAPGEAIYWEDAFNRTSVGTMAFVDMPEELSQLADLLKFVPAGRLAPIFYTKSPKYLQKMPSKADFAKVYKFARSFSDVSLRTQYDAIVSHLQIDRNMLTLILQVFSDAKFVTIIDGVLNAVPAPQQVVLEEMPSYQRFVAQRELEQQLIYSSTSELEILLTNLSKQES